MDRLTFEGNFCDISQCEATPGGSYCENGACSQRKVWERLREFENLGYTPAALAKLVKFDEVMKRTGLTADRIYDLIVADEAGRMAVLPCKVGDTVYFVNAKNILEFTVVGYAVNETGVSWIYSEHVYKPGDTYERAFTPDRIGKNTFLSREEAEKALEARNGDQ